jgi:hypothetical protein
MIYRSAFKIGVLDRLPGVAWGYDLPCRTSSAGTFGFTTTMWSRRFARGRSGHR